MLKTIKQKLLKTDKKAIVGSASAILCYIFALNYFFDEEFLVSNTIDGIQFGFFFIIFGLFVSFLILLILKWIKFIETKYFTQIVYIGTLIIPFMIVMKMGYQINEKFGDGKKIVMTSLVSKKTREFAPFPSYGIIIDNKAINTLRVSKELWKELKIGDSVVFKIKKGFFGYEIVSDINKTLK